MYSFDIFDTIITRTIATPKGIFAIMQQRLQNDSAYDDIDEHIRNHFYNLRICAERLARDSYYDTEVHDITLVQIYEALGAGGMLTEGQSERLQALEIQTEYDNIIGITANIQKIKSLIQSGNKVVLISDMYLDKEVIRKLLVKVDTVFETIPIYVSSEYKKTKYEGDLYELAAEKENEGSFKDWYHIGDNAEGDFLKAASYGIRSEHYRFEPLQPYEEQLLIGNENNAAVQIFTGTSRNSRLMFAKAPAISGSVVQNRAFRAGCGLGGPMLYPYIQWVLRQCEIHNIKRLYFIARDGYVLKKIADKLIAWSGQDIKTYYFYGSRKAWRLPSLTIDEFDVRDILKNSYVHKLHTVDDIADFFEIPVKVLQSVLPVIEVLKDKILSADAAASLIEMLCQDTCFQQAVCQIQQKKRAGVLAYIRQEINVAEQDFAFVELSGTGLTQECLAKIFEDITDLPIRTFYLKKDRYHKSARNLCYAYFLGDMPLSYMIEELCRAPHGQTTGYRMEKGRMLPVLADDEKDALEKHGYSSYIDGVLTFSRLYYQALQSNNHIKDCDSISIFVKYMEYMTRKPDQETADFLGDMPFNLTGRDKEEALFAPKLSQEQLEQIFLTRYQEPVEMYYKGSSLEYSLLRCSKEEQELVSLYREKNRELNWSRTIHNCPGIDAGWGKEHAYADEYDLIAKNIILYAAGKKGQLLHSQLEQRAEYHIIAWIDADYQRYQKQYLNVLNPEVIRQLEYDQVVIGVLDKKVADEIKAVLVQLGVPKKKILWVKPRPRA